MLLREQVNDGARRLIVGKVKQRSRDPRHEALVRVSQRELESKIGDEAVVGVVTVLDGPFDEPLDETLTKARVRRPLGADEHHDHGRSVGEAVVE